jgi:hypothetical protein
MHARCCPIPVSTWNSVQSVPSSHALQSIHGICTCRCRSPGDLSSVKSNRCSMPSQAAQLWQLVLDRLSFTLLLEVLLQGPAE